ncbi:carotenoid synthesis regulator CarF, partial [bacterium]|nr:carotenoid synthesis regulator CarF [bacterium]
MTTDVVAAVQQQSAADLAKHYTWKKQLLEVCSVVVFTTLFALMLLRLWRELDLRVYAWLLSLAFAMSMVVADLVSGLVHWLADTWGTVEFPILGPTLIKNFREHHADPKALTRKGLIETNGDNCMILLPAQAGAFLIPLDGRAEWVFLYAFVCSFTFWIMVTNQVHKWAHMELEELSWPVRLLQRTRLILPTTEHVIHHTVPFESHYCITNGWLNTVLARTGFYRRLEWLGWRVTGAIPRENDIGTSAAVALAIRQGVLPEGFEPGRSVVG